MSATLLLAATTGAAASAAVVSKSLSMGMTFIASPALGTGETGVIQVSPDNGATWINLVVGGNTQQLSPSDTAITVYGAVLCRVNKSASASATAIYVAQPSD